MKRKPDYVNTPAQENQEIIFSWLYRVCILAMAFFCIWYLPLFFKAAAIFIIILTFI